MKRTYVNEQIRPPEVRLIDEQGEDQGVMPTSKALALARSKTMDLVEVSPVARPPVCKIMDFGQFKYRQDKQMRKQRGRQKRTGVKGIRIGLTTGEHDLDMKAKQAAKFLEEGHRLKIELMLRGRQNARPDLARARLESFAATIDFADKEIEKQERQGNKFFLFIGRK